MIWIQGKKLDKNSANPGRNTSERKRKNTAKSSKETTQDRLSNGGDLGRTTNKNRGRWWQEKDPKTTPQETKTSIWCQKGEN